MKTVPNDLISTLCRYLPLLVDNIDRNAVGKSLRLANAIRVTKYKLLPKLKKVDKSKGTAK